MNRAVLLTSILLSFSAYADEELHQFNIEAGEAPAALTEYCAQSDRQVLFDYKELRHHRTHSVAGKLTPSEALKVMLQGTDLVADSVDERTIAIRTK